MELLAEADGVAKREGADATPGPAEPPQEIANMATITTMAGPIAKRRQ